MTSTHDSKLPSTAVNIQDVFLNSVRRDRLPVTIKLMDGSDLEGRIKNFDRFAIIVEHDGADRMIFKHAISAITSTRTMSTYYVTHDA